MKLYVAEWSIDHETSGNIIIADTYEKALQAIADYLNYQIYLGDVYGRPYAGNYRHYNGCVDILSISEYNLNRTLFTQEDIVKWKRLLLIYGSEIEIFTHSTEFHKGQDFTPELLESWNKKNN